MKTQLKALAAAMGLVLASGFAQAESTYGYNATGAGPVVATARVTVNVTVPRMILLRVGTSGATVDALNFAASLGIPGGLTAAAVTLAGTGDSLASGWDGATAPTFTAPTAQSLVASAWTNSTGGGQLGLATVVNTALAGLSPASITVTPTAGAGALPAHPANTATNANFGTFARNVVHSASWAYSVSAVALGAADPGSYSQETTYTATSL